MAAPVIQNKSSVDGSRVFNKPAGLVDGDVIYIQLNAFCGDTNNRWVDPSNLPGAPAGFTQVYVNTGFSNDFAPLVACYRKIITNAAGEPSTYTVSAAPLHSTGHYYGGVIYRVSGANTTTPEDDFGSVFSSGNPADTGTIIDSSGSEALLLVVCTNATYTSPGLPSGMTNDATLDGGDAHCYSQTISSQLISAQRTSSFPGTTQYAIGFVVVKPASGGGSVDITGTPATVAVSSNVGVTGSDPVKIADRGIRTSTSAGDATVTLTNPTQIAIGNYLVARVAVDNSGSSGARPGLTTSDVRNSTWTHGTGALQDPGAASAGISVYLCYIKVTTAYQVGDTVLFDYTTGSPLSAIVIEEWANIDTITPLAVAEVQANNVSTTAQPALSRTPTAVGQLMYVAAGIEGLSSYWGAQDSDSTGGTWSDVTKDQANTGTGSTSVSVYGGYKVVTSTAAQTWNNTLGTTSDWAACAVVFAKAVTTTNIIGSPATVAVSAGSAVAAGTASVTGTPASVAVSAGSATIGIGINITGTPATVVVTAGSATITATTAVTGTSATVAAQSTSATIGVAGTFTENFTGTENADLANGWANDSTFGGSSAMPKYKSNRGSTNNSVGPHVAWKLHGLGSLVAHDWQIDFDCNAPLVIGNGGVAIALLSNTTAAGLGIFIGNAVHIQVFSAGGSHVNITNVDRPGSTGSLQNHITFTHRGSDGFMEAFLDGSSFASWTDNSQSAGNMVYINVQDTTSPTNEAWIDTLVISDTITGPPGGGTNITGTPATVVVTAGSAVLTANTVITGTSSSVVVHASSATVSGNAAIIGTPTSVAVHAGSATVSGQANVIGSSAVVAVQSSTATLTATTAVTGTSATVAITAGSGVISLAVIGTSATVVVTAGSAVVTGNAAVTGTSANITVQAGSAVVTGNAAVTGTSAIVVVNAGSAVLTANTAITGTSATVVINAGSAVLTATTSITGTSATVSVSAGSATIVLAVSVTGASAVVAVHAGTGTIGVQTDITCAPATVAVHANSATVTGYAAITGTSATVAVHAGTGTIGTTDSITGTSGVVTVTAGTGIIGVQTAIIGISAVIAVLAGSGQITAEGSYILPAIQGAIIIL